MATIDVKVPAIGDYKDVPVIDVLVKPGERVSVDAPLVTLESDKATMDVPSPAAGTVRELKVKIGDRVAEGTVVLTLEQDGAGAQPQKRSDAGREQESESDAAKASRLEPVEGKDAAPARGMKETPPPPKGAVEAAVPKREEAAKPEPAKRREAAPAGGARAATAAAGGAAAGGGETIEVKVPVIGNYADVPIIDVLVKPGDTVTANAPLVTLESDKATMDVPAPVGGTVRELKVKTGDHVSEGSVLLLLATSEAPPQESDAARGVRLDVIEGREPGAAAQASAAATLRPEPGTRSEARAEPARAERAPTGAARGDEAAVRPVRAAPEAGGGAPAHASPSVRKLARELGVDLTEVNGSGPKGRVLHDDVQHFVKEAMTARPSGGGGLGLDLPAWPKVDFAKFGPVEAKPLSRIRKLSKGNLGRNWVTIPHVTQYDEADITDLERFRKELNAEAGKDGVKVTLLAFLVKACVATLKKFPEVNASLDGDQLVLKHYFHIGFAADTPNGLVVPVLRDADKKGIVDIARELAELAAKAREGKLSLSDIQGGSFSISSLGGIGGTAFTQIVNAPEVAILGVSRSAMKPVWNGESFEPRLMLPISLSYDHRVVDGALGARFITHLSGILGDMRRAML
ncbi:MAG TPA: dihydrolipoyllysine-residue acetyltransferase [Anaeromyxobacteraceae bacterium]|nr:dihydrolipoyllysine-residue acetyltransferase [Anaeromyxobacteraceae bacterium]